MKNDLMSPATRALNLWLGQYSFRATGKKFKIVFLGKLQKCLRRLGIGRHTPLVGGAEILRRMHHLHPRQGLNGLNNFLPLFLRVEPYEKSSSGAGKNRARRLAHPVTV